MSWRCGIFRLAWASPLVRVGEGEIPGNRTCPGHSRTRRKPGLMGGVGALLICLLAVARSAGAHPLSQGALDVTVHRDRVTVRARVTLEEVSVTNMLVPPAPGEAVEPATSLAA